MRLFRHDVRRQILLSPVRSTIREGHPGAWKGSFPVHSAIGSFNLKTGVMELVFVGPSQLPITEGLWE